MRRSTRAQNVGNELAIIEPLRVPFDEFTEAGRHAVTEFAGRDGAQKPLAALLHGHQRCRIQLYGRVLISDGGDILPGDVGKTG